MKTPTVVILLAGSAIAFDEGGEILETVDYLEDGSPDWTTAAVCDPRGGGGAQGFAALGEALMAAERNAQLMGVDIVRVAPHQLLRLPEVAARVQLAHDVERYPHFIAPAGALGTVVGHDNGMYSVRLDKPLAGAEDWDNEVHWYLDAGDNPMRDLVALDDAIGTGKVVE